jgi:hypothetical protein
MDGLSGLDASAAFVSQGMYACEYVFDAGTLPTAGDQAAIRANQVAYFGTRRYSFDLSNTDFIWLRAPTGQTLLEPMEPGVGCHR